MKVNRNSQAVSPSPADSSERKSGEKKSTAQKQPDTARALKASADRFARVASSRFNQIQTEAKPSQADHRAKVPEGTMPGTADVGGRAGAALDDSIAGPTQGNSVDGDLRERADSGLGLDRDQLAQGRQVDGRNPMDGYRGGADLGIGNPYGGTGREAAGKLPARTMAFIDHARLRMYEAALNGDYATVEAWASEVSSELGKGPGSTTDEPSAYEKNRQTEKGTKTKVAKEANAVKVALFKAELEKKKAEREKKAEEAKKTEGQGSTEETAPVEDDRLEDDAADEFTSDREVEYSAPDLHKEFTDFYLGMKIEAMKNSETNPGDQMEGPVGELGTVDSENYTANYGEGHRTPGADEIEAGMRRAEDAAGRDEEF